MVDAMETEHSSELQNLVVLARAKHHLASLAWRVDIVALKKGNKSFDSHRLQCYS